MNMLLSTIHQPVLGYHLLRVVTAVLMLFHGYAKLVNGVDGIAGLLTGLGLPAFAAYGVLIGEVVAPLLVLSGFFVAPAALVMAINMVVAVLLVHTGHFFTLGKSGGWSIELQAFFFFSSLAIALMAPVKAAGKAT